MFDYDEERKTYFFPEYKQDMFTSKGGNNSLVNTTEALVLITGQYEELQKCFRKNGPSGGFYGGMLLVGCVELACHISCRVNVKQKDQPCNWFMTCSISLVHYCSGLSIL